VSVDGGAPVTVTLGSGLTWAAAELADTDHTATVEVIEGEAGVAALTVRSEWPFWLRWVVPGLLVALVVYAFFRQIVRVIRSYRKPKTPPPPPPPSDEPPVYPRRLLWKGVQR
jgi:hypothetical protein